MVLSQRGLHNGTQPAGATQWYSVSGGYTMVLSQRGLHIVHMYLGYLLGTGTAVSHSIACSPLRHRLVVEECVDGGVGEAEVEERLLGGVQADEEQVGLLLGAVVVAPPEFPNRSQLITQVGATELALRLVLDVVVPAERERVLSVQMVVLGLQKLILHGST
jgi:hypothetical protein